MGKTIEDRVNEMLEVIVKVARGDYSLQIELSDKNDALDSLAVGINMMVDDLDAGTIGREYVYQRTEEILEIIQNVARGNYEKLCKLHNKNDRFDALAISINMMVDDIQNNVTELEMEREKVIEQSIELNEKVIKLEKSESATLNIMRDLQMTQKELETVNKTLERKVKERTAEVEKLLKQKDEFINQLGHDLKNPLGPLITLLPILEEDEADPERKEIFDALNRNVSHMKNLVTKTLQLARLKTPGVKLSFEDTNLLSEIDNVIEKSKLLFEENNIEVENKISENIMIKVDKLRLTELFDNLINNAVKYTKDSGTITIDAKQDKDFVTVSIKDTGMGMTEEQLSRTFDEFYKADWARHDFNSSGLGLPICKRIVEKHGGKIWAESEGEGKGSTMFFTLPSAAKNDMKLENMQREGR